MHRFLAAAVTLMTVSFAFGQTDLAGSKDYPGISRVPGYYIAEYQETPFDSYEFTIAEGSSRKQQTIEGRKIEFRYNLKDGAAMPSPLQIVRNYQNAARTVGSKVLYDTKELTTIRLSKAGSEVWFAVETSNEPSGMFIRMVVVEKKTMQQEVTVDADAMAHDIGETGRVAVYGILFDTGKADLKPESAAALAEIAKMLKTRPAMKVYIVGHTDMTADLATNLKLSMARAQAVVSALTTQHGIAVTRMTPFGAGPYAPVASNRSEEGRAKNRRVELVEIATQ